MANPIIVPRRDRVVNQNGTITKAWAEYFSELSEREAVSATTVSTVELTSQSASIATTSMPIQNVRIATYRVSYSTRITTAASTSSDLTITIGWTEGSQTLSQSGATISGNTVTSQQNGTLFFLSDAASPITYSTTYASTGATAMVYRLLIKVELVG